MPASGGGERTLLDLPLYRLVHPRLCRVGLTSTGGLCTTNRVHISHQAHKRGVYVHKGILQKPALLPLQYCSCHFHNCCKRRWEIKNTHTKINYKPSKKTTNQNQTQLQQSDSKRVPHLVGPAGLHPARTHLFEALRGTSNAYDKKIKNMQRFKFLHLCRCSYAYSGATRLFLGKERRHKHRTFFRGT